MRCDCEILWYEVVHRIQNKLYSSLFCERKKMNEKRVAKIAVGPKGIHSKFSKNLQFNCNLRALIRRTNDDNYDRFI